MIYSKKEQLKLINDPKCIYQFITGKDQLILVTYYKLFKNCGYIPISRIINNPCHEVIRLVKIKERLKKL